MISTKERRELLNQLFHAIKEREDALCGALKRDLGKCRFEAIATETSIVLEDVAMFRRNLERWSRPRRVRCSLQNQPASGKIIPEPYGRVLIFSAWNYPFQLMMSPAVGAFAAGNRTVLKPSELAPATADAIAELVASVFPPELMSVERGGPETAERLLQEQWDYVFYTGGAEIGRRIAVAAAEKLTPVTLELGGKSPCVVDQDAKLDLSARRIVWGKFLNAGQTCVAPDYLLVHRSVRDALLERLRECIRAFYGDDPEQSPDYPRIVNERHFDRLLALANGRPVQCRRASRFIAPTLIPDAREDEPIMREEIFGPLLPVLTFDRIEDAIRFIVRRPKPLALYYYGFANRERILAETSSGSVGVNECVTQLVNASMPFGGIGPSGMGAYHGKWSFDTFTHWKPVMCKATWMDLPARYPPNLDKRIGLLKAMTK